MTPSSDDTAALITRSEAFSQGLRDADICRLLRQGAWRALARGAYVTASPQSLLAVPPARVRSPDVTLVRPRALAALQTRRRPAALAGVDAALAWGLPSPLADPPCVEFVRGSGTTHRRGGVRTAVRRSWDVPVPLGQGAATITGPLTTVVDCAHLLPGRDALAIADAALRAGLIRQEDLARVVTSLGRRSGTARARRVLQLADGRRESPLESWSAWEFDVAGLPAPRWQVTILRASQGFVARVDCFWDVGLVGEADGRAKARLHRATRKGWSVDGVGRVLEDERQRESQLRDCHLHVIRWSARDLLDEVRCRRLIADLRRRLAELGDTPARLVPDAQIF